MWNSLEFFSLTILRPFILFLGLFGNSIGLLVLLRKKLIKIGPRNVYRYLFLVDLLTLFKLAHPDVFRKFAISSSIVCKISAYFIISIVTVSPWLIVYISVEKFITIRFPGFKSVLRRTNNQFIYFILVIILNFTYHIPTAILFDIIKDDQITNDSNLTRNQSACIPLDSSSDVLISYMDLISRVIVPSLLMIICTLLLIYTVFKSRSRVIYHYTLKENRTFKRDLKLAFSSILINCIYGLLSLPFFLLFCFDDYLSDYYYNVITSLVTYLFFASYAINFFLLIGTNSLFRNECCILSKKKSCFFVFVFILTIGLTVINCYKVDISF